MRLFKFTDEKNKAIFIFTILIFTISSFSVFAQTEATTNDGQKVILNDDGTWKYTKTTQTNYIVSFECSDLISTETDKMTGHSITGAIKKLVISDDGSKNGFGIFLLRASNTIIFNIHAVGAGGCIDDENKMNVLFRDGTRLELINDGDFNCDEEFTLYFGEAFGKKKQLEIFRTKEIETMRIWTTKSYVEKDFSSDQSKQLMKTIDCLMNN